MLSRTSRAVALGVVAVSLVGCPNEGAVWHADADIDVDTGDRTGFFVKEVTSGDMSRLVIVDDPAGAYGKVYRANLTPADIAANDERAEWRGAYAGDGSTKVKLGVAGTENVWVGWRSLFGADVVATHGNDGNYMQFKGDSSCGGPVAGLTISNGRLTLRSELYGTKWTGPLMPALTNGAWHDFLLHIQFSKNAAVGYVELSLDGAQQVMTNGLTRIYFSTMCPNDTYVYPKWGVYGMDYAVGGGPVHWVESPRFGPTMGSAEPR